MKNTHKFNFSMRKCLYLVKDVQTKVLFFTQYFKPEVRPIKVFNKGLDVTHYLTHRANLTNHSYFFLATTSQTFGFTVDELRAFFKIEKRTKHLIQQDAQRKSKSKYPGFGFSIALSDVIEQPAVPPPARAPIVGDAPPSPTQALLNSQSVDTQAKKRKYSEDEEPSAELSQFGERLLFAKLSKPQHLRTLLQFCATGPYACPNLKLPVSRFELYAQLSELGFTKENFHRVVSKFISDVYPELKERTIISQYISSLIGFYGVLESGTSDVQRRSFSWSQPWENFIPKFSPV